MVRPIQEIPPRDATVRRAVSPPEPYAQLMPGTPIQVGDLWHRGGNAWEVVTVAEIGKPVPTMIGDGCVARLTMPEGCVAILEHEMVGERDLFWATVEGDWTPVPAGWAGKAVQAVYDALHENNKQSGYRCYMCRPTAPVDNSGCENVPAHFRRLGVGEVVRRGDRWWFNGHWEGCPGAVGNTVRDTQAKHFIRPMAMDARTWYVDLREGHGDDASGLGSHERPFATVDGAVKRIEETFKNPCGILWDVRGVVIMAWDVPEPSVAQIPELDVMSDAVLIPSRPVHARTAVAVAEDKQVLAAAAEEADSAVIKNRSANADPAADALAMVPGGFRLLRAGEVIRDSDIFRTLLTGHWVPIHEGSDGDQYLSVMIPDTGDDWGRPMPHPIHFARPVAVPGVGARPQRSGGPEYTVGSAPPPDGWRELFHGEELRAGDLVWDKRWKSWYPVSRRDIRMELQTGERACRVCAA